MTAGWSEMLYGSWKTRQMSRIERMDDHVRLSLDRIAQSTSYNTTVYSIMIHFHSTVPHLLLSMDTSSCTYSLPAGLYIPQAMCIIMKCIVITFSIVKRRLQLIINSCTRYSKCQR